MKKKKLKYKVQLNSFPECPPKTYCNDNMESYRWVSEKPTENDFIPLNLKREPPPRMLDDTDLLCKGYGLSFFDTQLHAFKQYNRLYTKRRKNQRLDFKEEYGDSIAKTNLSENDGLIGDCNTETGHFTFHMYDDSSLCSQVVEILNIFDENGEINNLNE